MDLLLSSVRASSFIDIDNRPQLTVSSFTTPTGDQGATSTFTLTLDRQVPATQVLINAFTFPSNVTIAISPTSGNASVYTITATNPSDETGSYNIALDADTIEATTTYKSGPLESDTNRTSGTITYDTRQAITATFTGPTSSTSNRITDSTSQFVLTLNKSVPTEEISNSDFPLSAGTISSITPVSPTNGNASTYNILVNNPSFASGSYTISFNANSVPDSSSYTEGPSAIITNTLYYDTTTDADASWETPIYDSSRNRLTANISFSYDITGIIKFGF